MNLKKNLVKPITFNHILLLLPN